MTVWPKYFFAESIKRHPRTSKDSVRHQKRHERHQRTADDSSRHQNPSNDITEGHRAPGFSNNEGRLMEHKSGMRSRRFSGLPIFRLMFRAYNARTNFRKFA